VPYISTLNNVIAVVVVILMLSLIVQSIQSTFKKMLAIKSKQIEDSLVDLFEHVVGNAPVTPAATWLQRLLKRTPLPRIIGRDGMIANSPVLRTLLMRPDLTKRASKPTQDLIEAIRLQFQRMGRLSQRGKLMLDSLSREDLLKVLARIAPETLVPGFLAKVQNVCNQVTAVKNAVAALKTADLPGDANAVFARLQDGLAPLLNDYATITTGGTVNAGVLVGDVMNFGSRAYTDALTTLGEVQSKVGAAITAAGGAGKAPALDQAAKDLQAIAAEITKLRALADHELAGLRTKLNEVNTWFDTVMQSFNERYARGMKTWAVVISAVVVVCLNANLMTIYNAVKGNPTLSAELVAKGEQMVKDDTTTGTTTTDTADTKGPVNDGVPLDVDAEVKKDVQNVKAQIDEYTALGFQPITWSEVSTWWGDLRTFDQTWGGRRLGDLRTVVGWIIMILLLSLGAPFWHDALESLFGVKNLLRQQSGTKNVEEQSGAGNPKT
jgi:hypothetical protein